MKIKRINIRNTSNVDPEIKLEKNVRPILGIINSGVYILYWRRRFGICCYQSSTETYSDFKFPQE